MFGLTAGEVITHSNVANLVVHSDMSLLGVLQYAVQQYGIEDIRVCGNYDCGGVAAAMSPQQNGLLDSWLTQVRDVVRLHEKELLRIADDQQRLRRLVELNVVGASAQPGQNQHRPEYVAEWAHAAAARSCL